MTGGEWSRGEIHCFFLFGVQQFQLVVREARPSLAPLERISPPSIFQKAELVMKNLANRRLKFLPCA